MFFYNRHRIYNLELVRKTNFCAIRPAFIQDSVVITSAVTETMAGPVKHHPRDNYQVQKGRRNPIACQRLRNSERTRDQIVKAGDLNKLEILTGNARIGDHLADLQSPTGNCFCQHLVVNGTVQGKNLYFGQQFRSEKFLLDLFAKLVTLFLR